MKKIKVLQVNKLYYPITGGVERVVQQIAEGLKDRTDMKVLVCEKKGHSNVELVNGVEIHRAASAGMAFSMPLSFSFFGQFCKLSYQSDIIHIHMPFPLADIAALISGYKGKVVLWWHSDIIKQKKLLLLYRPFLMWLLKRADCIMVATQGHIDGSDFLTSFRSKCVVIPYGVDSYLLSKSDKLVRIPMPVRDTLSVLFVGRFVYYKGCDILLKAFSKTHGAHLNLVGEGPLKNSLLKLSHNLGLDDRVHFLDNVDDHTLSKYFYECDFFVLPSTARSEAFGLVQIEAMSYGKPVINTNLLSGVPYVSLDGKTGFTVEPGNVNALAQAMQTLIDDPALREQFSQAAYRRAREDFSMERMLDRIYEEYEKLVN